MVLSKMRILILKAKKSLKNNMLMLRHWLSSLLKRDPKAELSNDGSSAFHSGEDKKMWLFVGLGNPGDKYKGNRHNVGFMTLDVMADGAFHFPPFKSSSKLSGDITETTENGQKIILLKPQTYMNESGRSVGATARFYKIPPERIIVYHDELDLPPGELRMKKGGGNAGHNGLKSIQAHLGTPDFWRVRIGIGRPAHKGEVSNYVLNDFAKADAGWLDEVIHFLSDTYWQILENGAEHYAENVSKYSKK